MGFTFNRRGIFTLGLCSTGPEILICALFIRGLRDGSDKIVGEVMLPDVLLFHLLTLDELMNFQFS